MISFFFGILDNILALYITKHFVKRTAYRLLFLFIGVGAVVTFLMVLRHRNVRSKLFLDLFGLAVQLLSILLTVLRVLYIGLSF